MTGMQIRTNPPSNNSAWAVRRLKDRPLTGCRASQASKMVLKTKDQLSAMVAVRIDSTSDEPASASDIGINAMVATSVPSVSKLTA